MQLMAIERGHELRDHIEKLGSAGGLLAYVKKEKRHEKTVSAMTKAMCALQDTDGIAEDCKKEWESFVTAIGAKKVVGAFTTMKGECLESVTNDLVKATANMDEVLKVGSQRLWKDGLAEECGWQAMSAAAKSILAQDKATSITNAYSQLSEDWLHPNLYSS